MVSPLFDRSIARVPPRRHHARPCNANVVTGTGRKPRPSRMRRLPMAFSLPWRRTEIPAHTVFTAALDRASRPKLSISGAWRVRKIELVGGRPIVVRVTATGHLMEVGGRDFYYPGPLCLRSVARHF